MLSGETTRSTTDQEDERRKQMGRSVSVRIG